MNGKKNTARKQSSKDHQVLAKLRALDKKFDKKFNGLDKKSSGLNEKFNGLNKKFNGLNKKFNGLNKKFNGLDKKFKNLDKKVDDYRQENVVDRKSFSRILFRYREEQRIEHEELVAKFDAFTDKILTIMDGVRKNYDDAQQERAILGAVQDRQRGEIETLQLSDEKQNQLLASLNTRVTTLEMNKAA